MYYILFHYTEGLRAKDFYASRTEGGVIEFLHKNYKGIEVIHIIEVKAEYRLGIIVTEEYVKSSLQPEEESESLVELEKKPEEIIKENKKTLEELEAGEPSAMSKIADDIEEEIKEDELTDEEKVEEAIDEADRLIEREKLMQEQKKKGWKLCSKCNSNRVAPWNKKGICSPCQNERKTERPHTRSKEFAGL